MTMKTTIATACLLCVGMFATPAAAVCALSDPGCGASGLYGQRSFDRPDPYARSSQGYRSLYQPRPADGPYDRPTLGSPAPRRYGKTPTLGDPRPYRRTNPRTCTGLLCN